MNLQEAQTAWEADASAFEARGVYMPDVKSYVPDGFANDYGLAMDAQVPSTLATSSGIPAILTTMIDPVIFKTLFSPTKAAEILGEVRKGTWLDDTAIFPSVEHNGEVSSYGDFNENGRAGANTNWPQRQNYLFQVIKEFGDREIERAGLARIGWVQEVDAAAADILNRFSNYTYFFGVQGLQNYGLLNDPDLSASLTPGVKAAGHGNVWIYNGQITATANEIYADLQALFAQLVAQTGGLVEETDELVVVLSPGAAVALTAANSFNVNVRALLKENFPKIRFVTAVQYGVQSTTNPQGVAGGNFIQMIAPRVQGQQVGYAAYSEKMRTHPIVRQASSYKQKVTGGTWGAIIRFPPAIASMIGI